jgi:CHRD domain-containing protein
MKIRKQSRRTTVAAALPLLFAMPMALSADEGAERVRAHLVGYEEVPTLSSNGSASFSAKIAEDEQSFDWVLTYTGLANVTQAHIHFAARAISGPIVIWLCSNLGNGPPGTQACPASVGTAKVTVTGTARPADVTAGALALGIPAGDLARMLDAIRAGAAYANVHTVARPGGEIRGQIHSHGDH